LETLNMTLRWGGGGGVVFQLEGLYPLGVGSGVKISLCTAQYIAYIDCTYIVHTLAVLIRS